MLHAPNHCLLRAHGGMDLLQEVTTRLPTSYIPFGFGANNLLFVISHSDMRDLDRQLSSTYKMSNLTAFWPKQYNKKKKFILTFLAATKS